MIVQSDCFWVICDRRKCSNESKEWSSKQSLEEHCKRMGWKLFDIDGKQFHFCPACVIADLKAPVEVTGG